MTQRCTRYFFLLNLFGFFFLSAAALEAEPVERSKCSGDSCVLSACPSVDHSPAFSYNLQPILSVAVARDADPSAETSNVSAVTRTVAQPHTSVPTLAVAPKQSPPVFA